MSCTHMLELGEPVEAITLQKVCVPCLGPTPYPVVGTGHSVVVSDDRDKSRWHREVLN